MVVISITGCPGVGKTFLAKQLSSYLNSPVILEGEEGTIPKWVFEDVFSGGSPIKRWEYFINKHNIIFKRIKMISKLDILGIIDINENMVSSLIEYEKKEYKLEIENLIEKKYSKFSSDITILLISKKETLIDFIKKRNRESEINPEMINRSIYIQNNLKNLLKNQKKTIVINREDYDFTKEEDIKKLIEKFEKWL